MINKYGTINQKNTVHDTIFFFPGDLSRETFQVYDGGNLQTKKIFLIFGSGLFFCYMHQMHEQYFFFCRQSSMCAEKTSICKKIFCIAIKNLRHEERFFAREQCAASRVRFLVGLLSLLPYWARTMRTNSSQLMFPWASSLPWMRDSTSSSVIFSPRPTRRWRNSAAEISPLPSCKKKI